MEERIGVCCSVVVGEVREGVKMKNGRKVVRLEPVVGWSNVYNM